MEKLTVIIPFLNEKEEVENTLKSILSHCKKHIPIILINDCSDDNYDYDSLPERYKIEYLKNDFRIGVAASRELGINMCDTPYFLLLDAHMRFYDDRWLDRIIIELEKNDRVIVCCQTKALVTEKSSYSKFENMQQVYGAYVNFFYYPLKYFSPIWAIKPMPGYESFNTIPVACILGAGYAGSKKYWKYLKGLQGLLSFGSDEPYLSMKVWMEGGKCLLLKDVVIGHLYRLKENIPYTNKAIHINYNQLLIADLLLPVQHKKRFLCELRLQDSFKYDKLMRLYWDNKSGIDKLREYYQSIFKHDFSYFKEINQKVIPQQFIGGKSIELYELALSLIITYDSNKHIGLDGRMGTIIFLYHYARYDNNQTINDLAGAFLVGLLQEISQKKKLINCGLFGVGWGLLYLTINDFIDGEIEEILEQIDRKITFSLINRIKDYSLYTGLGSLILYICIRLYSLKKEEKIFKDDILFSFTNKIKLFLQDDVDSNATDLYLQYLNDNHGESYSNFYDLYSLILICAQKESIVSSGFNGKAGIGIKQILDTQFNSE